MARYSVYVQDLGFTYQGRSGRAAEDALWAAKAFCQRHTVTATILYCTAHAKGAVTYIDGLEHVETPRASGTLDGRPYLSNREQAAKVFSETELGANKY